MKKTLILMLVFGLCVPAMAENAVKEGGMMFPDGRPMQPSDFAAEPISVPEKGMMQADEELPPPPDAIAGDENSAAEAVAEQASDAQGRRSQRAKAKKARADKKLKSAQTPRRRAKKKAAQKPERQPAKQAGGDKVPPEMSDANGEPVPAEKTVEQSAEKPTEDMPPANPEK